MHIVEPNSIITTTVRENGGNYEKQNAEFNYLKVSVDRCEQIIALIIVTVISFTLTFVGVMELYCRMKYSDSKAKGPRTST